MKKLVFGCADAFDRFTAWFFCLRADPTLRGLPARILVAAALGAAIGTAVGIVKSAPEYALSTVYLSQPGREAELGEILNRCKRGDESPQQCKSAERAIQKEY